LPPWLAQSLSVGIDFRSGKGGAYVRLQKIPSRPGNPCVRPRYPMWTHEPFSRRRPLVWELGLGTICSYSFPFFRVLCLSSISTCKDPIRPDTEFSRMIRPAAESARLTRNRPMPRSSDAPTHGPHVGGAPPAGSKGASQSHLPPGPTCGRPTRSRGAPNLLRCRAPSSASRNLHKFRLFPDADHPSIQPRFRTSCQRG
jgi:hypothetical protein